MHFKFYSHFFLLFCCILNLTSYICKVNKAQNTKSNIMNFQELNILIASLKKDKKANKELITFYEAKRRQILTEAFNKGFEK